MTCFVEPEKNPYIGTNHLSSKYEQDFNYKGVSEYDQQEWLDNIFINPWDNANHLDGFSFIDKRSGVLYSLMSVGMPHNQVMKLIDSPDDCKWLINRYYENRFYHAKKLGNFFKVR
jgi:hypothetical protein